MLAKVKNWIGLIGVNLGLVKENIPVSEIENIKMIETNYNEIKAGRLNSINENLKSGKKNLDFGDAMFQYTLTKQLSKMEISEKEFIFKKSE